MKTRFMFEKSRRMFLLCSQRVGRSEISFPLTPALSLGERENRRPLLGEGDAGGLTKPLEKVHPLPKGEGRGEGEAGAQPSATPIHFRAVQICQAMSLVLATAAYLAMICPASAADDLKAALQQVLLEEEG